MHSFTTAVILGLLPECLALSQGFVAMEANYRQPAPLLVAPGQLVTIYVNVGDLDQPIQASSLPLSSKLGGLEANISVLFTSGFPGGISVPILSVFPVQLAAPGVFGVTPNGPMVNAVTVQIPYELSPPLGSLTDQSRVLLGIRADPSAGFSPSVALVLQSDAIHILRSGDTIMSPVDAHGSYGVVPNLMPPVITHADGSTVTPTNPAKVGETIAIWAVGLGAPSSGIVNSGEANPSPPLTTTVRVDWDFRSNASPSMPSAIDTGGSHVPAIKIPAYFAPGYVGLYQINVKIPAPPVPLESCGGTSQSNLTINIGGTASYDGAGICVGSQ